MPCCMQVRFVSETFLKMAPEATQLLKLLFTLVYAFAALGMSLFGGLITTDPDEAQAALLAKSSFGQAGYYPNNFNDLASGFVVCFELLVLNNWFVLAEGFVAVTSPAARIFFVAFYLFGVLICLNLIVAFAIDAFMAHADEEKHRRNGGAPGDGGDGDAPAVAPLRIDTTGDGHANAVAYDTNGDGRFDTVGVMAGARAAPNGGAGGASAVATAVADSDSGEKATADRVRAAVAPTDNGVARYR